MILENRWPVPRYEPALLPEDLTWQEDPYGESYWRFIFYSLRPTRHLLWSYYSTGEDRYLAKLQSVLEDFAESGHDSDFTTDLHGVAFRGLVLTNTYLQLQASGDLSASLAAVLLETIEATGKFLADPAHYQAQQNHGVTQAVSLLSIGNAFPELAQSVEWKDLGLTRLQNALESTIDEDGVQVENSPFYHFYELRLAVRS